MLLKSYKLLSKVFNSIKNIGLALALFFSSVTYASAETSDASSSVSATAKATAVSGENILSMVLSLILILAIILLLAWGARRFGGMAFKGSHALKILTGISMGARERIVLVQVGEQQLLLGISPGRIQTLHVLDKPISLDAGGEPVASAFANRLKSILNKSK